MSCLLVIIGLCVPRILLFGIFLLTNWFSRAYETIIWPLLGFFFMPYTTLVYMAYMIQEGNLVAGWIIAFVVAILGDLGAWGSSSSSSKK